MSQPRERSGLQTLADAARMIKAAARIARAAALAGLKGAAVAAVKEALPFLVKLAVGILIAVILIPMLIFTAIPNLFFGFDGSKTQPVMDMTAQAMSIGAAYFSLEDLEKTQVDSIVTSLVSDYEESGVSIDKVHVENSFSKDDLLWMVAINSVSHQQNLTAMSTSDIRSFCVSSITYAPSLLPLGKDSGKATLTVRFEKLDPEVLMERLDFDEDAKTWAGALYEVLSESDALDKYASHYEAYRPDYSGDGSYGGDVSHGGSYSNLIDTSAFVNPGTKNNIDLAIYARQALENNWGYVWGTYGSVLTQSLFDYKLRQYPDGVGNHEEYIREHWLGRRTTDCIGLIKGYGWLDPESLIIKYATNGMPDYGANQMYQAAKDAGSECGSIDTMPDVVGLILWMNGHAGVYIGGGYAIEAMGTEYGVVRTEVAGRGWQAWYKIPYIDYIEE